MLAECARPHVEAARALYREEERLYPEQGVVGVDRVNGAVIHVNGGMFGG